MKRKKKKIPTRHKFRIGDMVGFIFAGTTRVGKIIELTKEENKHATYTITSKDIIYPCIGLVDSKDVGNIVTKYND